MSTSSKQLLVEGVAYHSINKYITFYASKVDIVRNNSLIERGVNIGVSGEDARVRLTHPDHRADARGTGNHEIKDTPIVKEGGVPNTTIGEVIIIMH